MTTQCRCRKVGSTVWEDMAGRSLFSLLFGEWFGYATRGWSEIKRKSFGTGMLFVAVIWLLCLLGDYLLPPLAVLRTYFDEAHWILGKIVLWLLALPVGFPIGYHLTRRRLLRRAEREAQELALASELFVEGSLNMFAHETNVDMESRIIAFDLYEMGDQLKPTALNVTMETIQNRVAANRLRGKYTWVFVDEVYLFFKYHFSAQFLYKAWKRFRKYAGIMTAATQNVEECLRSETARLMFANSEFLVLYNQAATDRAELAKLLRISDTQMGYITNSAPGTGLIRMGGAIVPFINTIPKDTQLYRLMSTTPGDEAETARVPSWDRSDG